MTNTPNIIADLRKDYALATLDESSVDADPLQQFKKWLDEAIAAQLPEPNAMTLATIGLNGRPRSRIVLIKTLDARGIGFFSNYESSKGQELAANPFAALQFHWVELERQVRIEGRVEKMSAEESDRYFESRPLASKIGAWASPQSQLLPNRGFLEKKEKELREQFNINDFPKGPPRPPQWGGFLFTPASFEFWQGRRSRLHDRILYSLHQGSEWTRQRLAP